jgi:chorismate mutase
MPPVPPAPPTKPAAEVELAPTDAAAQVDKPWAADRLVGLLSARLRVMHDVARWKWHANRPIEDPEREEKLLADMEQRAGELKLDRKQVRALFAAQLTASKLVQQADFERWKATAPPPQDGPDLQRDLRPQIDQLNRDLLECWSDCAPRFAQSEFRDYLLQKAAQVFSQQGIADDVKRAALAPLQESAAKNE